MIARALFLLLLALPAQAHRTDATTSAPTCAYAIAAEPNADPLMIVRAVVEQHTEPTLTEKAHLIFWLRVRQKGDRGIATVLNQGKLPPPPNEPEWTKALVSDLLAAYRDEVLQAAGPPVLQRRAGQDAAYFAMRSAGFAQSDVVNYFNGIGLNGVSWTRESFDSRYSDKLGVIERLLGDAGTRATFTEQELFVLVSQLRRLVKKGAPAHDILRREGIPLPAGTASWSTHAIVNVLAAHADHAYANTDRQLLAVRTILIEAVTAYAAAGLNDAEIALVLTKWGVLPPQATEWSDRAVTRIRKAGGTEPSAPRVATSHYPWRLTDADFRETSEAFLGRGVHEREAVRRKIIWMRWHGMSLDAIADVLKDHAIRTLKQIEPWDAKRVHDVLAEGEKTVLRSVAAAARITEEHAHPVIDALDGISYTPEQIAEYLTVNRYPRAGSQVWEPKAVAQYLMARPRPEAPDASTGVEGYAAEHWLEQQRLRWRGGPTHVDLESIPRGMTDLRQIQVLLLWLRWHGFAPKIIAGILEQRGARLPLQENSWNPETVNTQIRMARQEVFFGLTTLDRSDPKHAELALRRLDAAAFSPTNIALVASRFGLRQPDSEAWSADRVAALLSRPNAPLFQRGVYPSEDPFDFSPTGIRRRTMPWRPELPDGVWREEGEKFLPKGLAYSARNQPRIRAAIATLHWYGNPVQSIARILRQRNIAAPPGAQGWDYDAISQILKKERRRLEREALELDRLDPASGGNAIRLLDKARWVPGRISSFLRAQAFATEDGGLWTVPAVIAVLREGGYPWRPTPNEFAARGGMALAPQTFANGAELASFVAWVRWHGLSFSRIDAFLEERKQTQWGNAEHLCAVARRTAYEESREVYYARRHSSWIIARNLDRVEVPPEEIAAYLRQRKITRLNNQDWTPELVISLLRQRPLPGYAYVRSFDDRATAEPNLVAALEVATDLEERKRKNIEKNVALYYAMPLLKPDEERLLLYSIHLLRHRASVEAYRLGPAAERDPHQYPEIRGMLQLALRFRTIVFEANTRLVDSRLPTTLPKGFTNEDLRQIGGFAVLRSIDAFNVGMENKFSTLAVRAIINLFHREMSRPFDASRYVDTVSISADVTTDEHDIPLSSRILDREPSARDTTFDLNYDWTMLEEGLGRLNPQQRQVLSFTYGLDQHRILSDTEIAYRLNIPADHVEILRGEALLLLSSSVGSPFREDDE